MPTTSYYPVFEPDQVLTDTHLNALFAYLDQQEHLTRNKLLGIGIVCGLHTSISGSSITITKGVGITSLGYLLQVDGDVYSHYRPYKLPDFPETIEPAVHASYAGWTAQELIPLTRPKEDTDIALTSAQDLLKTHAVVLFLEPMLTDLKNCTTDDCNDKGKRVDITVRPLLVPKASLQSYKYYSLQQQKFNFPNVHLQRWNVPSKMMQHPSNVVQAFDAVLNAKLIRELDAACTFIYNLFHSMFAGDTADSGLQQVFGYLTELIRTVRLSNTIHYQYVYDYVDDLIRAYGDFREVVFDVLNECCPDEHLFPLHLMLGDADQNSEDTRTAYRNYFVYSPLFVGQRNGLEEAQMLYRRLALLLQHFRLPDPVKNEAGKLPIHITPSYLGKGGLGTRCIPYYYRPQPILSFWDFQKSRRGMESLNYGYLASQYSSDPATVQPLLYDTEAYNFYRIEGHAGKPVTAALRTLAEQKVQYNLPFDVVALNMYPNASLSSGDKLKCYFNDLESSYNVLLSELLCKLHGLYCAAGKFPFNARIFEALFNAKNNNAFPANQPAMQKEFVGKSTADAAASANPAAGVDINREHVALGQTYATDFKGSLARVQQAAVSFVDSARKVNPYKKGSYMQAFCRPGAKDVTVARYYLNWVAANPGKSWPKPQPLTAGDANNITAWWAVAYAHFFYLIDSIEEMLATVLPYDLNEVNYKHFKLRYDLVMAEVEAYADFFENFFYGAGVAQATADKAANKPFDPVAEEVQDWLMEKVVGKLVADSRGMLMICFDDRLEQLQYEYRKRVAYVLEQHIFSGYAKLKTGLEHKAGVPKGGTFVMLYYNRPDAALTAVRPDGVQVPQRKSQQAAGETVRMSRESARMLADREAGDAEALFGQAAGKGADKNPEEFLSASGEGLNIAGGRPHAVRADKDTLRIPEGIVFADLYIPYMCCSDCAPTAFVFQETKDDAPQPEVSIKTTFFCNDQDVKEPVTVAPDGGVLSGQGTSTEGTSHFFNPKGLAEGDYVLSYRTDATKAATVSVTVKNTPDPEFAYSEKGKDTSGNGTIIAFMANAQAGAHTWDFGDGSPADLTANPVHTFLVQKGLEASFTVTHTVTNGNCTLPPVTKIILVKRENPVKLDIKRTKLCTNDKPEPLAYTPAGGKMICDQKQEAIIVQAGLFYFSPAVSGAGSFVVRYDLDGLFKEITIDVSVPPSPEFTFKVISFKPDLITVQFTSITPDGTHLWKFSDGQAPTDPNPKIAFKRNPTGGPTSVDVTHSVSGAVCQDKVTRTITLVEDIKVVESSRTLCYTGQPVPLEPNMTPNDKLEVLQNGGQSINEKGELLLSPATGIGNTAFSISYRFTTGGTTVEKHIALTVSRIDGSVSVTNQNAQSTFKSAGETAVWTLSRQAVAGAANPVVILKATPGNPIVIKTGMLPTTVEIAFLIDVTVTSGQCTETFHKVIPKAQYEAWIRAGGTINL